MRRNNLPFLARFAPELAVYQAVYRADNKIINVNKLMEQVGFERARLNLIVKKLIENGKIKEKKVTKMRLFYIE